MPLSEGKLSQLITFKVGRHVFSWVSISQWLIVGILGWGIGILGWGPKKRIPNHQAPNQQLTNEKPHRSSCHTPSALAEWNVNCNRRHWPKTKHIPSQYTRCSIWIPMRCDYILLILKGRQYTANPKSKMFLTVQVNNKVFLRCKSCWMFGNFEGAPERFDKIWVLYQGCIKMVGTSFFPKWQFE